MDQPEERPPGPDDTAAFQRFYGTAPGDGDRSRSRIYRLLVGWWRDRA